MNGSPAKLGTISGTAGHSSALKMRAEENAASALKQKEERETSWWRGEEGLIPDELQPKVNRPKVKTEHGKNVEAEKIAEKAKKAKLTKHGTKTYKTAYEEQGTGSKYKTQKEFDTAADKWWESEAGQKKASAKGSKFAHRIIKKEEPVTDTEVKPTRKEKVEIKAADKVTKIKEKSAKRVGEVGENVTKRVAKISRREARKQFGKGSKEHLAAKQAHLEAKATDIQGGKGGRKRGLFRGLATKINLKKQKKNQAKIDAAKEEENA